MAASLYGNPRFPVFTRSVDHCASILRWNPLAPFVGDTNEQIQCGIFVLELALANLLVEQFRIEPRYLLGHSLGEYACATLCQVFTVEDALQLVQLRGQLLDQAKGSASEMLAVAASEEELSLPPNVVVCCRNARERLVLGGNQDAIRAYKAVLTERGIQNSLLRTTAAFHTIAVRPLVEPMREKLRSVHLKQPTWPMVSSVTGSIDAEVANPEYWIRQMLDAVEFSTAAHACAEKAGSHAVWLEVGPNQTLCQLMKCNDLALAAVIPTMQRPKDVFVTRDGEVLAGPCQSVPFLLEAVGAAWAHGAKIDLSVDMEWTAAGKGRVVPLPPVLWNRQPCWAQQVETLPVEMVPEGPTSSLFYRQSWMSRPRPHPTTEDMFVPCVRLEETGSTAVVSMEELGAYAERYGTCALLGLGDEDEDPEEQISIAVRLIRFFQAIHDVRLRGTVVVLRDVARYEGVAAFCRSAQKERPGLNVRIVHIAGPLTQERILQVIRCEILQNDHEVRIDHVGARSVRTLHYAEPAEDVRLRATNLRFSGDRWVIVTGGSSGIGREVAEWARARGAKVCILARRPHVSRASDHHIRQCACDVSDASAVRRIVESLGGACNVEVVFHCAGVVADRIIDSMEPSRDFVLPLVQSKIHGAKNIVDAVAPHVRVVMFSSSSAALGPSGQGLYCFANQYMDALCEKRANCVAVQWGGWKVGMTATHNIAPLAGEAFLDVDSGLEALSLVLSGPLENVLVMETENMASYAETIGVSPELVLPLLTNGIPALPGPIDFTSLALHGLTFMRDHQFDGRVVIAGTFWLEVFSRLHRNLIAAPTVVLQDIEFLHACGASSVRVLATRFDEEWMFEVKEGEMVVARARASATKHADSGILRLQWEETLRAMTFAPDSVGDLYRDFADAGFEYGPRFRLVDSVQKGDGIVASTVCAEESLDWDLGASAATIDACTHIASLVHSAGFGGIPCRIKRVEVGPASATKWRALCAPSKVRSETTGMAVDLVLLGSRCITMEGFDMKPWPRVEDVYSVSWIPFDKTSIDCDDPWLIVGKDSWSRQLAAMLPCSASFTSEDKIPSVLRGIVLPASEDVPKWERLLAQYGAAPCLAHCGARLWIRGRGASGPHAVVDCDNDPRSIRAFANVLQASKSPKWLRVVDGVASVPTLEPVELKLPTMQYGGSSSSTAPVKVVRDPAAGSSVGTMT